MKATGLFVAKVCKLSAKIAHGGSCRAFQHQSATQSFLQSITATFRSLMPKAVGTVMNQKNSTIKCEFYDMPFEGGVMM